MASPWRIFRRALKAVPAVVQTVVPLVQAVEAPGNGAAKRDAVVKAVGDGYDVAALHATAEGLTLEDTIRRSDVEQLAGGVTDIIVRLFNVVGWPGREAE